MDAVRNMIESGNYLIPFYNCHERFEKPPLLYWLVILSSKIFGLNEFSARLVSGISAIGVSFLTYLIAKEYIKDEKRAFFSFIVSLTLIHYWIESRAVVPEMLLTFFMTLGLYLFIKERFILGWISLSLAFLTKGPVGVFLPVSVYLILKRNFKVFNLKGILLFLLLGGSWYYVMLIKYGYEYFYKFFIYENVMRFTGERKVHPYPFWYYIPVVLVSTIFYIPFYYKVTKAVKKHFPVFLWALFVILFFSLSKNKLHHYILFSYPAIAILIAEAVSERYLKRVLIISSLLIIFLSFGLYYYENLRFVPKAYPIIKNSSENAYFYRAEVSSLVYYSGKCIKSLENETPKGLVITKEKYKKKFKSCETLARGIEFDGKYVLLRCN